MSERMIELQRARLLAAGKGKRNADGQNGAQPSQNRTVVPSPTAAHKRQTPQQAAIAAMRQEDAHMERFIQRLQQRDDSRAGSASGPTVPTALARRILNKEGAGSLDGTVAAVASAAADRFLATVLQQAVACRDQRLKGAEMAREASRVRKRHIQQVQADSDDRKRRKEEHEKIREQANEAAIQAGETLKKGVTTTSSKDADGSPSKSKKKKKAGDAPLTNGNRLKRIPEDDEESYDSLDEEEQYYQEYYGDETGDVDDDEEEDDTLILRDLARPLEAWDFHVSGKRGLLPPSQEENEDVDLPPDEEEELQALSANQNQAQDDADEGGDNSGDDTAVKTAASSKTRARSKSPRGQKRKATTPPPPGAATPPASSSAQPNSKD